MYPVSNIIDLFLRTTPILPWAFLTFGFWLIEDGTIHRWDRRRLNIFCGLAVCVASFITAPFFVKVTEWVTGSVGVGFIPVNPLPQYPVLSFFLSVVLFILALDFFFYWWHRAEHKIPVLWDIHAIHHSEETFNATTYMRQNWMDGFLQNLSVQMPVVILFHFTPEAQGAALLTVAIWNFLAHADLKWDIGRWSFLATGPQLHRLHHSKLKQHRDRNFAQFFPCWDILFRTYIAPLPGEFPPTGLGTNQRIETLPDFINHPLRSWVRRGRDFINKA